MSQYILILAWIGLLAILSNTINIYQIEYVQGRKAVRVTKWFAIISVIPLIWWAATRPEGFIDTGTYVGLYQRMPSSIREINTYLEEVIAKDPGFSALSIIIKMFVGDNATLYLGVIAGIQALIVALVLRKYSCNFPLALFIFIASTDYLSWMQNGIRQFMSVVIIFAATGLMLNKKYWQMIIVVLLASRFHGSTLLMLPIIFVVQGKAWNKKTLLSIVAVVLAIVFVDRFTNVLDTLLSDTQYTNVVSDWQSGGDDGTSLLRVLVYALPTILSLIGLRYIREEDDPVINLACNMGIMSTMLYCLSAVTSGIFIGRLPIFCSLYATCILLPWEVEHMFTEESVKLMKVGLVGGFLLFYLVQIHFVWGLI